MPNLFTDTSTLGVAKYLSEPVEGVFHPFFPYGPFGWGRSRNGTVPGPTTNNRRPLLLLVNAILIYVFIFASLTCLLTFI